MSGLDYSKWDNLEDSDDETPAPVPAPSRAPPTSQQAPPDLSSINIDDDRSEVEKLKAKKRTDRAAREAAKAKNPTPESEKPFMEPVNLAPVVDTNAADAIQSSSQAEKQLTTAEGTLVSIQKEIADLTAEAPNKTDETAPGMKKRTLALQGQVGKLQNSLDEIYLGELDDAARDAAKLRRKAINRLLEGALPEQIMALKKLVM